MSNLVFPNLPGMDIAIKRTPVYATKIQTASSGKELRASFQSTPRYRYALPLNFLRQAVLNATNDEVDQLLTFFGAQKGRWDSFWLPDSMVLNQVPNGASEDANPSGFSATGVLSGYPAYCRSGVKCRILENLTVTPTGYVSLQVTDFIACNPGDQFYFEQWVYKPQAQGSTYAYIEFYQADKVTTTAGVLSTVLTSAATYTKQSLVATAPANTAYVLFKPTVNGIYSQDVFFDDLFACRMATAGLIAAPDGLLTQVGPALDFQRRVRFDTDELEFDRFLAQVWEAKSLPFISVK